jgi:hypothetical protein
MSLSNKTSFLNIFSLYLDICVSTNSETGLTEDTGKAIPLQALADPEGSRRLRLPDFKTIGT